MSAAVGTVPFVPSMTFHLEIKKGFADRMSVELARTDWSGNRQAVTFGLLITLDVAAKACCPGSIGGWGEGSRWVNRLVVRGDRARVVAEVNGVHLVRSSVWDF